MSGQGKPRGGQGQITNPMLCYAMLCYAMLCFAMQTRFRSLFHAFADTGRQSDRYSTQMASSREGARAARSGQGGAGSGQEEPGGTGEARRGRELPEHGLRNGRQLHVLKHRGQSDAPVTHFRKGLLKATTVTHFEAPESPFSRTSGDPYGTLFFIV